jgi:hypothetical protein
MGKCGRRDSDVPSAYKATSRNHKNAVRDYMKIGPEKLYSWIARATDAIW